ncbi:VWA domain-containing protein [Scrofimicrobium sp. R131]|uniref:VWA domain-containing protein n=1 Tax=Scrofimicrobium appendicitidis TaxID=3079930 RepID=A0AAU7V7F4_9ACTO
MRYPWLTALILVAAGALLAWQLARRSEATRTWLANSATLFALPSFRTQQRRYRVLMGSAAGAVLAAVCASAVLAGAPVDRRVENPALARRDLVLCLDASGSMLPYDGQILDHMREVSAHFSGERMALQMWSAQTVVKFSLTDDYQLIDDVLAEAAGVIRRGYMGEEGEYVLVSNELFDYLHGVDAPDGEEIASLVGDGLASCVLGFDHRDQERSRTVILVTDNEVQGPQIYTLEQAVKFATDQDVQIIALYPSPDGALTSEGEALRSLVEGAGGTFYQADDPGSVEGIVADIQAQQLVEAEGRNRVVETDRPRTAALWLAGSSLLLLALLAWRRL